MTPQELFQSGKLQAAIDAVTQEIKSRPNDASRRTLLFELLSFQGDLDRAEKQLQIVRQQEEKTEWSVQVYTNLLEAERKRRALFEHGIPPEFFLDPPADIRQHLEGVRRWHAQPEEAEALIAEAEETRADVSGKLNETPFTEIRDCDDRLAPVLEMHVLRDYTWVPWSQITELEVMPPERPRDLIWCPIRVALVDGRQQRGYAPVLYVHSFRSDDDQLKLGRATDWSPLSENSVEGLGQKLILIGDEAHPILGLPSLVLSPPEA